MRKTRVDPDNEALRRITDDLEKHFRALLHGAAWPAGAQKMTASADASFSFMCAHDSLNDDATQTELTPHLIADCTSLCNQVVDATTRDRLGDSGQTSYAAQAAASQKAVKTLKKSIIRATAKATKTKKKADAAAAKVEKSGGKASKKVKAAAKKAMTQWLKAQEAVVETKRKARVAEKTATKAVANAEIAAKIQAGIAECWRAVVNTPTASDSHFADDCERPAYVQSCQVYAAPCLKCKVVACKCKY